MLSIVKKNGNVDIVILSPKEKADYYEIYRSCNTLNGPYELISDIKGNYKPDWSANRIAISTNGVKLEQYYYYKSAFTLLMENGRILAILDIYLHTAKHLNMNKS